MNRYRALDYEEPAPLSVRMLDGFAEVTHAVWWFARQLPRFVRKERLLEDEEHWLWVAPRSGPKIPKRRRR